MINIYRLVNDIETVCCYISEKNATYKEAIMGIWEVQIGVVTEDELDIQTGDYLKYNGVNYTLNRDDEFTQKSDVEWVYDLIFEHPLYTLLDKLITNPLTGASTFQLTGKLIDFVDIVVWITNKTVANPLGIDTGWTRGSVVDTDYKNISFSSVSCRDVLTLLSTEFNVEFLLANKQINYVERIENATGLTFIQGKGNGLYEVTKQNVDKGDTITRIYPVGGNKNVPNANADEQGYLKLPELYLENTSEIKRIVEKRVVFEDIFPYFLGSITSVGGTNSAEIICNDIDFNLTDIAVGSEARVNFLTGDLMGCSFEFQWNNALKKLTLIEQKDETALADAAGNKPTVPSALKKAKAGDKFNFTGVIMPATYVNNAIAKLRLKATDWLSFYSRKRIKFDVQVDNRWMRGKTDLKAGDLVTIKIPQKNIESLLRIVSLDKNLHTGKISATVSNYLDEKWEKKVEGAVSTLETTVQTGFAGVVNIDVLQNNDARPASDNNVMSSLRSKSEFISAKEPDTAAERITFQKGAVVRDLATPDFVQDKFAGAGAAIYEDEQGNTVIEADIMTVRKTAYFSEVQINQIRFQGGIMVYSAANLEVLSVADGGSYLQLNFDTKNGQIANQFEVDDQIRCQRLAGVSIVKYYMSRITSVGADYIRISKTDIDGTLNVEIGDQVVQFGNRSNTARQSLIEVNVVDGGKQTFYQGVNSYNLIDKNAIEIGRVYDNAEWKTMLRMYGDLFIGDRNLSSYFKYNSTTKQMDIAASLKFIAPDGSLKSVSDTFTGFESDKQNAVVNGKTIIVGGYLNTELIRTDMLIANRILTAETGERIALNINNDNALKIYDASNVMRVKLGHKDGVPAFIFYDATGAETFNLSSLGIGGSLTATRNIILNNGDFARTIDLDADGNIALHGGVHSVGNMKVDGLMDIGKYLDFHETENDGIDFSARLEARDNGIYFQSSNTSQLPAIQGYVNGFPDVQLINPFGGNVIVGGSVNTGQRLQVAGNIKADGLLIKDENNLSDVLIKNSYGTLTANGYQIGARIYKIDELLSQTFSSEDISNSVNAYVGKNLLQRVTAIETTGSQPVFNGTGFVKVAGSTVSYDNSTYSLSNHTHSYLSLDGGSMYNTNMVNGLNAQYFNNQPINNFHYNSDNYYSSRDANTIIGGYGLNTTGNAAGTNNNFPYGYGTVMTYDLGYGRTQLHFNYMGELTVRSKWGDTWSANRVVWDSGNFNPANKLDYRTFGSAANNNTGDFILNQNAVAQPANIKISGDVNANAATFTSTIQSKDITISNGEARLNLAGTTYGKTYTLGSLADGSFRIYNGSIYLLEIGPDNSATFASSVNANQFNGSGAGLTGNALSLVANSFKLYSSDSIYTYGSPNPYFGYLTYNGSTNRWRFAVSPATPANVEVNYADVAGNANNADNATTSTRLTVTDVRGDDRQPAYFSSYRIQPFFSNTISGLDGNWKSGINVAGWDAGSYNSWQLIGGSTTASFGEWYFREGLSSFGTPKRIWHSGNFNPDITKLWAESHPTSYYLKNNWDGQYWQLTSNHSSPVNVGHSDQSTNSDTVDGVHIWRGSRASYDALSKDGNTMYIIL